ncbi:putative pyruvate/2-oxoglutarate dehydrogenase complex, dihydrolipoamide acyltransferase [Yersinia pseudotuberculosis IP 32953]|uniref:Terminase n=2 Tax=Yersinia pseudotuberculosis complex TaxID=1649845 RepID=A0ABM5Q132_9GAMM|nr:MULTISPECIES: terminase [Yersinia pseudotuberculosis complex]AHK21002.1 terminase [Yersinia similis]AJJ56079.1 putative pyruvate/2-oxoglutarate dehydrogenase complex, dihydrolipoamide acyltransferase [Yersinia pseudotuberculosis IP 32953]PSH40409.1 terminase [Yersinia pseudotuberculosis]PSH44788.1 terminase [Yersinia pseudotuberculosis]
MGEAEQIAYIKAHLSDVWWRLNNLYKIVNEDGELVTFRMRPAQRELFKNMHYRNIILKARQLGFSTGIDIYLLDQALFNNNLSCGIIAQDLPAAGEIFSTKISIPFDNLPVWLRATFPVSTRREGANGGHIEFAHGSKIRVSTSFRSGTVQRLHISEHGKICATYPAKAKEVRTGTLNAIKDGCIVFIESTAEGVGGDFHTMSTRAMDLGQLNLPLTSQDYKFHFFAWWQDPKYQAPVPAGGLRLSKYHQEYFAAVEQAMGITLLDEQKQWYIRKEIEQQEEMKQEFPSTPSEAFLTSGRRVFAAINVMKAEGQCKSPLLVYDIEPVTGKRTKVQALRAGNAEELQRTLLNHLLVWELPDPDEDYAIGGDVAEGLENRDRSSFDVVKKSSGEQVAHWFGYLDAELFAQLMAHVGRWYNTAFIGPERNNHGHAVIQKLREVYPHRSIYSEQYLDRDHDDETPKLGWLTTAQSKPVIIEGLKTLLRENASGVRWIGTINELNTYVYDTRGRMNAQTGCFDDQVMSYAIAQEMRARMPARPKHTPIDRSKPKHWMAI